MSDKIVSYTSQLAAIDMIARRECLKPLRLSREAEELLLNHLRAVSVTVRNLAKIKAVKQ